MSETRGTTLTAIGPTGRPLERGDLIADRTGKAYAFSYAKREDTNTQSGLILFHRIDSKGNAVGEEISSYSNVMNVEVQLTITATEG